MHNSSIKTSTKFSPDEIRDIIENILKNIIKSFKKHKINKNEIIDKDEKLLMWDKVILKNKINYKNLKENNGKFSIPCIFIEYKNNESIKAYLNDKYKDIYNMENEICGNIECFIVVPEFVYNYFLNKNNVINNIKGFDMESDNSNDLFDYMQYNNPEIEESKNIADSEIDNKLVDSKNIKVKIVKESESSDINKEEKKKEKIQK